MRITFFPSTLHELIWEIFILACLQAYKSVGESTQIPLTYYENNVAATVHLLKTMSEYGCTRMVYSSSATVYGTPPEIPIPETTRLNADSPYGQTKIVCETILEDICLCTGLLKNEDLKKKTDCRL